MPLRLQPVTKIIRQLALREAISTIGEKAYLEVLESSVTKRSGTRSTAELSLRRNKGAASELLSGKRKEPSKAQIMRLCARFKAEASAFLLADTKDAPARAA